MLDLIKSKVHEYYWADDINCATTTLKILAQLFGLKLEKQVLDSAIGLHGAGGFGAQCGLVEGCLLFIGILGHNKNMSKDKIVALCYKFAETFQKHFGSLNCSNLRPAGNSEHLCESITVQAINFSCTFIKNEFLINR